MARISTRSKLKEEKGIRSVEDPISLWRAGEAFNTASSPLEGRG
jgi:hypothetical protein